MYCSDGVVYNETRGDKRDYICSETTSETGLTSASLRMNLGALCINYNMEDNWKTLCENNPDCYVKKVDVKEADFDFSVCVPKYPNGFDLENNYAYAQSVCGLASLTCKSAKVKRLFKSDKYINWGCRRDSFVKQMNDFCMNRIHKGRVNTFKMEMKKEYNQRSPLDEYLCKDCLEKVINWKADNPTEINEEDFDNKGLHFALAEQGIDIKEKIRTFVLN